MEEVGFVIQQRPYPPEWIFALDTPNFAPAPELWRWIKSIFLNPEHKLFNPDPCTSGSVLLSTDRRDVGKRWI